jgi:hypothetical protein
VHAQGSRLGRNHLHQSESLHAASLEKDPVCDCQVRSKCVLCFAIAKRATCASFISVMAGHAPSRSFPGHAQAAGSVLKGDQPKLTGSLALPELWMLWTYRWVHGLVGSCKNFAPFVAMEPPMCGLGRRVADSPVCVSVCLSVCLGNVADNPDARGMEGLRGLDGWDCR